jgi:hypothetical protein
MERPKIAPKKRLELLLQNYLKILLLYVEGKVLFRKIHIEVAGYCLSLKDSQKVNAVIIPMLHACF